MSTGQAVLWFSIFDWWQSSHGHSDIRLARALAVHRPVLFINSIGMRMPLPGRTERAGRRILRKLRSATRGLAQPDPTLPQLAVQTLLTPPSAGRLGDLAARWSAFQIRVALARLGWQAGPAIVTVPTAGPAARALVGDRILYYRSDRHGAFPGVSNAALQAEGYLLDHAAIVAYAARHLMAEESARTGPRARYLEHAVDPAKFHTKVVPDATLSAYPAPRLGFFGSLRGHGIDFDLLREVALALPKASLLVMGDRLDHASELRDVANIHLLPPRPNSEMPAAWAALDVALLPYRMTVWTRAIDPIKLREILALGIPIAAMPLPAVLPFRDQVVASVDREHFIDTVRLACKQGRNNPPDMPDWERQAQSLNGWLDELVISKRLASG